MLTILNILKIKNIIEEHHYTYQLDVGTFIVILHYKVFNVLIYIYFHLALNKKLDKSYLFLIYLDIHPLKY